MEIEIELQAFSVIRQGVKKVITVCQNLLLSMQLANMHCTVIPCIELWHVIIGLPYSPGIKILLKLSAAMWLNFVKVWMITFHFHFFRIWLAKRVLHWYFVKRIAKNGRLMCVLVTKSKVHVHVIQHLTREDF